MSHPTPILEQVRARTADLPPCDILAGQVKLLKWMSALGPDQLDEARRALLVLLARREDVNGMRLGLAAELGMKEARHVLLAHLYSSDFYPEDPAAESAWTDVARAQVCRTLATIRADAAAPVIARELRAHANPPDAGLHSLIRRVLRRTAPRDSLLPLLADEPPVHSRTLREFILLMEALCLLDASCHEEALRLSLAADAHHGLPRDPGAPCFTRHAFAGILAADDGHATARRLAAQLPARHRAHAGAAIDAAQAGLQLPAKP